MAEKKTGRQEYLERLLAKDPDYFKRIGARGGSVHRDRPFALDKELAAAAGAKGGAISKRGKTKK